MKLIAVSKGQPSERVEAVLQQGHQILGKNRVHSAAGNGLPWTTPVAARLVQ